MKIAYQLSLLLGPLTNELRRNKGPLTKSREVQKPQTELTNNPPEGIRPDGHNSVSHCRYLTSSQVIPLVESGSFLEPMLGA